MTRRRFTLQLVDADLPDEDPIELRQSTRAPGLRSPHTASNGEVLWRWWDPDTGQPLGMHYKRKGNALRLGEPAALKERHRRRTHARRIDKAEAKAADDVCQCGWVRARHGSAHDVAAIFTHDFVPADP